MLEWQLTVVVFLYGKGLTILKINRISSYKSALVINANIKYICCGRTEGLIEDKGGGFGAVDHVISAKDDLII